MRRVFDLTISYDISGSVSLDCSVCVLVFVCLQVTVCTPYLAQAGLEAFPSSRFNVGLSRASFTVLLYPCQCFLIPGLAHRVTLGVLIHATSESLTLSAFRFPRLAMKET